jgi:hypothetical protein
MAHRLIDDIRNEVRETQITMHKAMRVTIKALANTHGIADQDVRAFANHVQAVEALVARVSWLYERFVELEKELANAYEIIDDADASA